MGIKRHTSPTCAFCETTHAEHYRTVIRLTCNALRVSLNVHIQLTLFSIPGVLFNFKGQFSQNFDSKTRSLLRIKYVRIITANSPPAGRLFIRRIGGPPAAELLLHCFFSASFSQRATRWLTSFRVSRSGTGACFSVMMKTVLRIGSPPPCLSLCEGTRDHARRGEWIKYTNFFK